MGRALLTRKQHQSILDAACRIHSARNFREFASAAFDSISGLIQADLCTIALFQDGRLEDYFTTDAGAFNAEEVRFFEERPQVNPIVRDVLANGGDHPRRISDLLSLRGFRATEFYQECLRRNRFDYCLAAPFLLAGNNMVGISINRVSTDFTEAETAMLAGIRPHFDIAWNKLERIARLEAELLDLKRNPEANPAAWHGHLQLRALGLRRREAEVLGLLADRLTNAEIAVQLDISVRTVEAHLARIYETLHVRNRREAAEVARREMER